MAALPLSTMTRAEKLAALEAIWADLAADEAAFKSPAWHGEALAEAEAEVKAGRAHFVDWTAAKAELAKNLP